MHNSGLPMADYHKSESDPIYKVGVTWGFFDETWSTYHGGYNSIEEARTKLKEYIKEHDL